jgi:heme/copper-type cytochrome/quinol oxidase subunit 2
MKSSWYILTALVILATSAPTLALAQYENEGGDQGSTMILTIFSLTLYITISAILGVVGYSVWKVYKIRRKATKISV